MEFIGIGSSKINEGQISLINDIAIKSGLLIITDSNLDEEVVEGVRRFCDVKQIQNLLTCKKASHKPAISSDNLTEDLSNVYFDEGESVFLKFISEIDKILEEDYFIIFANEWSSNTRVRLEQVSVKEFISYFRLNNSWYLWLYDLESNAYYPELDIPLIFEIKKP